jgi:hypothetical protein
LGVHFSGDNFIGRVSIDSPLGVPSGLLNADANPNCTPSPPHETCDLASPAPLTVSFDLPQTVIRVNIFAYIERSGTGVPVTLKDASGNTISSFVLHNSETIVPLGFNNSQQLAGRFQLSASTPFTTVIFNKTLPNNGGFGIDSLEFLSKEKAGICPEKNVQHWDKIIFAITDPILAKKVNLTAGTELDIKVLDDPHKVVDIKQKVLDSLKVPTAPKKAIRILDVNYAIICASQTPSGIKSSVENATEAKY